MKATIYKNKIIGGWQISGYEHLGYWTSRKWATIYAMAMGIEIETL